MGSLINNGGDYAIGTNPSGAVNLATAIDIGNRVAAIHSDNISQFGGAITIAGGAIDTTVGNSTHGLALTGTGSIAGNGVIFAGNNGLRGEVNTQLTPSGGTLTINQSGNSTFQGIITGNGELHKQGIGTLTLQGTQGNLFSGGWDVRAGILELSKANGDAVAGSFLAVRGSGSSIVWNRSDQVGDNTTLNLISGGVMNLGGHSDVVGPLEAGAGVGNRLILGGGTLFVNQSTAFGFGATVEGSGAIIKRGAAPLTLNGTVGNPFTGAWDVHAGNLVLDQSNGDAVGGWYLAVRGGASVFWNRSHQVGDYTSIEMLSGGVMNLGAHSDTVGSLFGGNARLILGGGTLTINHRDPGYHFDGTVEGNGEIIKRGSETLTLRGTQSNPFTGGWDVREGALVLDKSSGDAVAGSFLAVRGSGSSIVWNRSDQVGDNTTLNLISGGVMNLGGHSDVVGPLEAGAGVGNRLILGGGTLTVNQSIGHGFHGVLEGTGTFVKQGAETLVLGGANTFTGRMQVNAGTLAVTGSLANNGSSHIFLAADADGDFSTGAPLIQRAVAANASYAGLGSTIIGGAGSSADILAGINDSLTTETVDMAWRLRTVSETTLLSEVLELNGTNQNLFVLQMRYDDTGLSDELGLAAAGGIMLGWNDDGAWVNSVDGNIGGMAQFVLGAWNNDMNLGHWGIDTDNNIAWAVLNHNSEFAVAFNPAAVPEPGSLALLGLTAVGGVLAAWRRKRLAQTPVGEAIHAE